MGQVLQPRVNRVPTRSCEGCHATDSTADLASKSGIARMSTMNFRSILTGCVLVGACISAPVASGAAHAGASKGPGNCSAAPAPGVNWNTCDKSNGTLTGVNLSAASLGWTNFKHANLSNTNLSYTKLDPPSGTGGAGGASEGSHRGTNFDSTILTGARVNGADLKWAEFHGVVSGGITGTPLSLPANWRIVNGFLIGPASNLTDADLTSANLTGAHFHNANLTNARLSGASMTGVVSGGITTTPLSLPTNWRIVHGFLIGPGAYLGYANLNHAVLDGFNLHGANLHAAVLAHAHLAGVISGGITTTPLSLPTNWRIVHGFLIGPGSNLTGANLTGANLVGAHLGGAKLMNATLTGANLAGAHLGGAQDWLNVTKTGAIFSTATTCPNNLKYGSGGNC